MRTDHDCAPVLEDEEDLAVDVALQAGHGERQRGAGVTCAGPPL